MKRFAFLAALAVSAIVLAQAHVQPSGGSSSSSGGGIDGGYVTATSGAATYYVDPTGSNSNACTSSGASACSTLGGALSKIPYRIQPGETQTVNVAAGTYTELVAFSRQLDGNVNIVGPALATYTPGSGTSTGSLTAVNNTNPAVLTDGTQNWPVNGLRGRFITMTSGTANAVIRVITDNTATTVTLASVFTSAPSAADTYTLQTPGAIITNSDVSIETLSVRLFGMGTTATALTITGLDFVSTGASTVDCRYTGAGSTSLSFQNSRCWSNGGVSGQGLAWQLGSTLVLGGGASVGVVVSNGFGLVSNIAAGINSPQTLGGRLQTANSFFYGEAGPGMFFQGVQGGSVSISSTSMTVETNSATATDAALKSYSPLSISGVNVFRCLQAGPSGFYAPSPTGVSTGTQVVRMNVPTAFFVGCSTGVRLQDGQSYADAFTRLDCGQVGTCISVADGARMHLPATFNTDAGVDISIDGTTYTKANLTGASPTRLPTLTPSLTGSTVWQ